MGDPFALQSQLLADLRLALDDALELDGQVRTAQVDLLQGGEALQHDLNVVELLNGLLGEVEKEVDLVLVVVDIPHLVEPLTGSFQFLVELLGLGADGFEGLGVQQVYAVAQGVQDGVDVHELVGRVPGASQLFGKVELGVDQLVLLQDLLRERRRGRRLDVQLKGGVQGKVRGRTGFELGEALAEELVHCYANLFFLVLVKDVIEGSPAFKSLESVGLRDVLDLELQILYLIKGTLALAYL